MRSSIIAFGIAALTAVTQAVPTEQAKRDLYVRSASADVSCGNDQVISCCNTNKATSDSNNGGLLGLGGLLDGVLGGSCSPLGLGSKIFFSLLPPKKNEILTKCQQSSVLVFPSPTPAVTTSLRAVPATRTYVSTYSRTLQKEEFFADYP